MNHIQTKKARLLAAHRRGGNIDYRGVFSVAREEYSR